MSERAYLFFVGALILMALYFSQNNIIFALCLWLVFEGVTNIRLTTMSQRLRNVTLPPGLTVFKTRQRVEMDALSAWRLSVAIFLSASFILLQVYKVEELWFLPWFMGFAIMGAGASGVCPMLLLLRWLGFK